MNPSDIWNLQTTFAILQTEGTSLFPLVICCIAIEHGLVEIVSFPDNSMVDLSSSLCKRLPEAVIYIKTHSITIESH